MRRIYYVPGLISLALMLPLGLWYLASRKAFLEQRSVTLTFPHPPDPKSLFNPIHWTPDPWDTIPDFECFGRLEEDLPVLRAFRDRIEELAAKKDGQTKVLLRFGPQAKYGSVMHAIESCRLSTQSYGLFGNDLWAFYFPKVPSADSTAVIAKYEAVLMCGTDYLPKPWWKTFVTNTLEPLGNSLRNVWPAIPLYILLAYFGIRRDLRDAGSSPE